MKKNPIIKKMLLLLTSLLFSVFVLTACTVNVNVNTPSAAKDETTEAPATEVTQEDIEKVIVGRWVTVERDGQPALTNKKKVYNFVSLTEAYVSLSRTDDPSWVNENKGDVVINGNVVTITTHPSEGGTVVDELIITDISANTFTTDFKHTHSNEGAEPIIREYAETFMRVDDDFSSDIIGTWEGKCISEGSVFDDGQKHRWEYKDDGTFVYYVKDGDEWTPSTNTLNEYFVEGNLLCTRWIEDDEENREWWELFIDGDTMRWVALREDKDGNTFTAEFEMTKVK